jgi:hypothetical protein
VDNNKDIFRAKQLNILLKSSSKASKAANKIIDNSLTNEIRSLINPEHLKLIDKGSKISEMSADSLNSYIKDLQKISK